MMFKNILTVHAALFRSSVLRALFPLALPIHLLAQSSDITFRVLLNGFCITGEYCIAQDRKGFMWFGGDNGLCRYDGYDFVAHRHDPTNGSSLSGDHITVIYEDASGVLWVAVDGLNKCDRRTELFFHYRHDPADSTSLSSDKIHSICESRDGTLWVGSDGGVDELDKSRAVLKHHRHDPTDKNSLTYDDVSIIYEDRSGTLWVGTWGGGLNEFDRVMQRFHSYRHKPSDPKSLDDDRVHSIYETRDGTFWIGTWGGLQMFNRDAKTFTSFKHEPAERTSLSDDRIQAILETSDGSFWIGTFGGLNLFDRQKGTFVGYGRRNGLCDNRIMSLFEDRSGILWIGTWGGINYLNPGLMQFAYHTAGPAGVDPPTTDIVTSILRRKSGELWLGTYGGGIVQYDSGRQGYRQYRYSPANRASLSSNDVFSVYEDRSGTIFVVTSNKLNKSDGKRKQFTCLLNNPADSDSLTCDSCQAVLEDHLGILWLGTATRGLVEFDRTKGTVRYHTHSPTDPHSLSGKTVNAIYEDRRGSLWIGTMRGLDRYDRERNEFDRYRNEPGNASSLACDNILAIYEDKGGGFWVRTEKGLDKLDRETGVCTHYTENDNANRLTDCSIQEDEKGNLWSSSDKAITKVIPPTGKVRLYPFSTGFQSREFDYRGGMTRSDRMFFGGIHGLVSFVPDSIKDNSYIPPVVITSVRTLYGREIKPDTSMGEVRRLNLSYRDLGFTLDFAALNYRSPEGNQYAYMLEGFDKDWIYSGSRHYASYTNLDGGSYLFKVKGSNNDGVWNDEGTSLAIIITPPWWKTWWFRGMLALMVIGMFYAFNRYRISKILALERVRLRIADDLHDDIGSELSSIALESDLIARQLPAGTPQQTRLSSLGRLVRNAGDNLRDAVWVVNPELDGFPDLLARIRAVAGKMLAGHHFTLDLPEDVPRFSLDMEFRRHVLMMFKEMLNNVVRHAEASNVRVIVEVAGKRLRLCVSDDGTGFDTGLESPGRGLAGLRSRAAAVKGTLTLESAPGSGTTVCLEADIILSDD